MWLDDDDEKVYYFVTRGSIWRVGFLCWLIGFVTGLLSMAAGMS